MFSQVIIIVIVLGFLINIAFSVNNIVIENEKLIITGSLGSEWNLDDIQEVALVEEIPIIKRRTGGFSSGSLKKGQFNLEELGQGKLYIYANRSPFLFIKGQDDYVFINAKDSDVTREWFRSLDLILNGRSVD